MKKIQLSLGFEALVDDEDFERVSQYKWYFARGYAKTFDKGTGSNRKLYLHRYIMSLGHFVDDPREIDHLNHNGLDNRKINLRVATRSSNMMNRERTIRKEFSSQFRGVAHRGGTSKIATHSNGNLYKHPSKPWLCYYGKRYIGTFSSEEEAAYCRDLVALREEGPAAQLNFPIEGLEAYCV